MMQLKSKFLDTQTFAVIIIKFEQKWPYCTAISSEDADGIANSTYPDSGAAMAQW